MLTNEQLETKLEQSPMPRVTKDFLIDRILSRKFTKITDTLTHCVLNLDNGFSVTGESACVHVGNYNKEIGEKIAYDNAFEKLWQLYGFLLAEETLKA